MLTRFFKWIWVTCLGFHWHEYSDWKQMSATNGHNYEFNVQVRYCKSCNYHEVENI